MNKSKKKRSFLQCQKRNAKKGRFGHGTQLPEETFSYFLRIWGVMQSSKNNEEEMQTLASNVFKELEGNEVNYSTNQMASRVIEVLMAHTTHEQFFKFMDAFTEDLRPICNDPYGSHVLQGGILISFQRCFKGEDDTERYRNFITRSGRFLLNNLEDFINENHPNHIIRTVLSGLSGNPVKDISTEISKVSQINDNVPIEFEELLIDYGNMILSFPQFGDFCNQNLTSALIQCLLLSLGKVNFKLNKKIIKLILKDLKARSEVESENNGGVLRLLEVVLIVADEKRFKKIYETLFKGKLKMFSCSKSWNFTVQKLLMNCKDKDLFEEIYTEVVEAMEEILEAGNNGVLLSLAKGCRKCKTKQLHFVAELQKILNCYEPEERKLQIVPLVSSLTTFDNYDPDTTNTNLHGTQIVQELLHFNKPIKIVDSLLNMSPNNLMKLLTDIRGCHITDAFVQSTFVGEKSRDRLIKKLKGNLVELAISKYGSRTLDAIYDAASVKSKILIMEELKSNQSQLSTTSFGNGFAFKTHLDNFRRDKDSWVKQINSSNTAEKFFADIIPKKKIKSEN